MTSAVAEKSPALCCSWSGGKDSCLALYESLAAGGQLACLVTMFTEDAHRSRSHGLAREVLEAQAAAIGVPLLAAAATWDDYEIAIPAFLTIVLMPFTSSITNGIGAGFITYIALQAARGRWREPGWLLWGITVLFAAYFALHPIKQALGVE